MDRDSAQVGSVEGVCAGTSRIAHRQLKPRRVSSPRDTQVHWRGRRKIAEPVPVDTSASTETSAIDTSAPDLSFESVYERLKVLAHRQLSGDGRATLDTTALVHELYLRMDGRTPLNFEHAGQFFNYAARAMRNLLINRARDRMRQKAGGEWAPVTLGVEDHANLAIASAEQALAIDEALGQLEGKDARAARVFELRYFAGLVPEQIAEIVGITRRTADRDWRYACAFLANALG